MREHIGRSRPTEGVFIFRRQPTIVFLTVCAERREPALANSRVHGALIDAWRVANAWHVGYYVVMPDHVHLFCAPNNDECSIERWIAFGNVSSVGKAGRIYRDFNRAASIIVFAAVRTTGTNGHMLRRIRFGQV